MTARRENRGTLAPSRQSCSATTTHAAMRPALCASFIALLSATATHAGPLETAIVDAMKLTDAANYSWSTNVDDDARSYAIDGQTDRASDLSLVNMPVVAAVRRRVSTATSSSGDLLNVAFKGDETYVVQTDKGWKTAGEIAAMTPADSNSGFGSGYPGGWGGGWGMRRGRRGMMGGMGGMGRGGFPADNGESGDSRGQMPAYSNLQKTLSRPHEEISIIVAGATDLKVDGDVVSGTLSDTAAKLLLVHPGQKELTPLAATGTFKLWLKDGALVKYEVKLDGKIAVLTNGDRREVEVHQTATTEIKNVGTTKFDLPDEAKKKLGVAVDAAPTPASKPAPTPKSST